MSEQTLNQACALARELMPLEIESVASEESARFVKDHIAGCTDCAIAYGEERQKQRQALLDAAPKKSERFEQTMRRMKAGTFVRRTTMVVGAVVLAAALCFAGYIAVLSAYNHRHLSVPLDDYTFELYRLENNTVVARDIFADREYDYDYRERTDAGGVYYGSIVASRAWEHVLPHYNMTNLYHQDGKLYTYRYEIYDGWADTGVQLVSVNEKEEIKEVRVEEWNGGNSCVVWQAGEDIPLLTDPDELDLVWGWKLPTLVFDSRDALEQAVEKAIEESGLSGESLAGMYWG